MGVSCARGYHGPEVLLLFASLAFFISCKEGEGGDTSAPEARCSLDGRYRSPGGDVEALPGCENLEIEVGPRGEEGSGPVVRMPLPEGPCAVVLDGTMACDEGLYTERQGLLAHFEGEGCGDSVFSVGSMYLAEFVRESAGKNTDLLRVEADIMVAFEGGAWLESTLSGVLEVPVSAEGGAGNCAASEVAFQTVDCGDNHTCGLDLEGGAWCWGTNQFGQGNAPAGQFLEIKAGMMNSCAQGEDGRLSCWGSDGFHQLSEVTSEPVVQYDVGGQNICAVDGSGAVSCWGWDDQGQSQAPQGEFDSISTGMQHACGLSAEGSVTCWGQEAANAGLATEELFSAISANYWHTCGLRPHGEILCWGVDEFGQSSPPGGQWQQVASAEHFTCGRNLQGEIQCWGLNSLGQLGSPPGTYKHLAGGSSHSCALDSAGGIHCWGPNTYGQNTPP